MCRRLHAQHCNAMHDFDPFTATLDEAQAQPGAYEVRGAVSQWAGAQQLTGRRAAYEADPLAGLAVCVCHDLVAPDWLAMAYMRAYYKVVNCQVRTWDEAFGPAFPKGRNLAAARRARRNRVKVALAVNEALRRDPTRTVGPALWQEIGEQVGEGKTRTEELWREALAIGMAVPVESIRLQAGVRRRQPASFGKLAGLRRLRR